MEWARLVRTRRWIGLLAPFILFGFTGPLVTRYQRELFRNLGGGIRVIVPPPSVGQAIDSYVRNVAQIGLLAVVAVAAWAVAIDARPEWAAFLRTRTNSVRRLLVPRCVVSAAAAGACFAAGLVCAWYETAVLIGRPPVGAMLAGACFGVVYLAFVVGVVTLWAGLTRSSVGVAALSLVTLLALPLLAVLPGVEPWLPSTLVGAVTSMTRGAPWTGYLRAAGVALGSGVGLAWTGARLIERREL